MSGRQTYRYRIIRFVERYASILLFSAALILLAASFARPHYEARLRRQLELIDAVLARQEKLDAYLKSEDLRRAPARRAYRIRLEYIEFFNASSSLLPAAARKWVDEREAEFR